MKKIISILVLVSLILMSVPAFAMSGSGTKSNPYLVSTPQDVCNIHNDLDGYYKLTADIDMSGIEFDPIGNESEGAFTGTIDGNGYTISNLDLDLPINKYVGFVGCLEGTIKNLDLIDIDALGYKYVGGIAGYSEETAHVINCNVNCNVTVIDQSIDKLYAGGVIGYNTGSLENCKTHGNIYSSSDIYAGEHYSGGISGYNCGTIIECFNYCKVIAEYRYSNAGGICGVNYGAISTCVNHGNVQSNPYMQYYISYEGGIVAQNCGTIYDCTNYGFVTSSDYSTNATESGGICGYTRQGSIINLCVNYGDIINHNTSTAINSGGVSGHADNASIIHCANFGRLDLRSSKGCSAGGIAGYVVRSTISECLNNGKISFDKLGNFQSYQQGIGGIVGFTLNDSIGGAIFNNINNGIINLSESDYGYHTAGRIIGYNYNSSADRCINIGKINVFMNGDYIGNKSNNYQLNNLYNDECATSLTVTQFSDYKNFPNLDFENVWFMDSKTNNGFPQLNNLPRHISLNNCVEIFDIGDSNRLFAYINGNSESVSWSCDDTEIATVSSNGTVTAKAVGTCTVTATNSEGMKANCLIYVYGRANSINLNKSETAIVAGFTEKLTYTENPDTANETVLWKSDNENVATVDQDGTVRAKTKGIASITATTTNSEVSASCSVTVAGNPITGVSLSTTSANMNVGENKTLTATISPTEYAGNITWSSTNNDVATVNNGVVTAKAPGTTVISIESDTNKTATCTVTVKAPVTELSFGKNDITLEKGYTQRLDLNILPLNTTDTISWSTSNSNYVSVSSDGIITANRVGTATITATSSSGKKAYCVVNVTEPTISVSSVTLNKTELILTQADKSQLTAEVLPSNATNKELVWISSNESVATVSNTGVVTATGVGTAIIKATANNGMYHECAVKVISASGSSIILSNTKASPSGTAQVKACIVRNPGISGYKFTVDYDDTLLTPISVEANYEFGGTLTTNLDDASRTEFNILWYSDSNVDTNSDLFTINFEVKDSAVYGDTSAISLNYGAKDICNTSGDSIALYIQDSTISIAEPLPGDIYEDDDVSVFDLTLLARYITGLETFTDRQLEAADVNDDNEVDIKDVVTLAQYIVGWSNIQLMSLRSFGAETANIKVGTASVNEMFEAEIPVCISNNPGVAGFRYVIEHSDDLEILSITPTMDGIKDNFQTNLGQQGDNDLIVSWYSTDNMTENGEIFKIKVRLTNPDADVSQISIKPADNNMCDQEKENVIAEYENGYVMNSNYIITNEIITDTAFNCELYFDNTFEEQTAKAILGFYDEQHKLVQFELKDITIKPGKVELHFDIENKPYSTYKLMLWEGLNSMRPLVDVR